MHHGTDIKISKPLRRSLSVILAVLIFIQSNQAVAISAEGLVAMPSVQAMLIAIANVNRAMRDAAENPMDKWRRENVQTAIRAMPAAIIGLAGEFQAGKLHEKDYPMVMSMLGGFVDVNAADGYKKFLQKPSADLIPKMGDNFPQQYVGPTQGGQAHHQSVAFDDGASKGASATTTALPDEPSAVKAAAMKGIGEKEAQAADSLGVIFDDGVKKAGETAPTSVRTNKSATASADASDESIMGRLERAMGGGSAPVQDSGSAPAARTVASGAPANSVLTNNVIIRRGPTPVENSLDSDFFEKADAKKGKRADFQLKPKPKYFQPGDGRLLLESALFNDFANAEQGCDGSCGQGQGGGGQAIAQILMGVAAIIAAIAPMVVAGIQAEAEKDIARTQAMAQIEMTNISAATSKFISNQNTQVTLQQTATAERINKLNQDGVTARLDMQLAELRSAREDAAQREKDRLAEEKRLNAERIALAQKQADDNLKLARQSLNAQLTQAGLTSGFTNSRNSSTGGLTSTSIAGQVASASTAGTSPASANPASTATGQAAAPSNRTIGDRIDNQGASSVATTNNSGGLNAVLGGNTSSGYGSVPSASSPGGGAGITIGERISSGSASSRAVSDGRTRLLSSASGSGASSSSGSSSSSSGGGVPGMPAGLAAPNVVQGSAPSGGHAFTVGKPLVASANESRALAALLSGPGHKGIRGSTSISRVNITSSEMASNQASPAGGGGDLTSFAAENTSFFAARRARTIVGNDAPAAEDKNAAVTDTSNLHNPPFPGSGHGGASAD